MNIRDTVVVSEDPVTDEELEGVEAVGGLVVQGEGRQVMQDGQQDGQGPGGQQPEVHPWHPCHGL